jgi:hypothetical protein
MLAAFNAISIETVSLRISPQSLSRPCGKIVCNPFHVNTKTLRQLGIKLFEPAILESGSKKRTNPTAETHQSASHCELNQHSTEVLPFSVCNRMNTQEMADSFAFCVRKCFLYQIPCRTCPGY